MRSEGLPVTSTWIDEEQTPDFTEAWPRYLEEASRCAAMIVYVEPGEILKDGLLEIGAALAGGADVFVVGQVDALVSAAHHPNLQLEETLALAMDAAKRSVQDRMVFFAGATSPAGQA